MPVKWNAELDQVLLVRILDACDIRPSQNDYKTMADTWPTHLEQPTPRAISEHLFKIRAQAKATMKGSDENGEGDKSPKKASPQKRKPRKAAPKEKGAGASNGKGKRKRGIMEEDPIESDDDGVELAVKVEPAADSEPEGSDTKRARVPKVKAEKGRSVTPRVAEGADFSNVDGNFEMDAF